MCYVPEYGNGKPDSVASDMDVFFISRRDEFSAFVFLAGTFRRQIARRFCKRVIRNPIEFCLCPQYKPKCRTEKTVVYTVRKRTSNTCLKILPFKHPSSLLRHVWSTQKTNMDRVANLIDPGLRTESKERDIPEPNKPWTRAYRPQTVSRSKWLALLFWFSVKYLFGDLYERQHAWTIKILRLECTNTDTSRTVRG